METVRFSRTTRAALAAILTALSGSAAAAQATTTSGGDVATFTQKHLVNHLIVGDSIEVAMAQLAANRTQNAAVKEFANQLIADQTAHIAQLNKLAAKADIGREANASDTAGAHLAGELAMLTSMAPDAAFDRAFVQDQIELHQTALDALKTLSPAATNADVRSDVSATLPAVEKHLAAAQQLAVQLNKPADAATQQADSTSRKATAAPAKADSASLKATAAPAKPDSASQKPDTAAAKPPVAKPPVAKPPV
jgi:putative membrane protein